jgi:hypothetical protein
VQLCESIEKISESVMARSLVRSALLCILLGHHDVGIDEVFFLCSCLKPQGPIESMYISPSTFIETLEAFLATVLLLQVSN